MKLALIFLFYISALGWAWGDSLASKNNEGNKLYKEGKINASELASALDSERMQDHIYGTYYPNTNIAKLKSFYKLKSRNY